MTEVERLRAALEEIRGVKLLTDCGIHPMRAAGIRHAFEITAEIATNALSGEPNSAPEIPPASNERCGGCGLQSDVPKCSFRCLRAERETARLTRERDEWAAKWHRVRAELAELKYPGMKGVIRPLSGEPTSAHETSGYSQAYAEQMREALLTIATSSLTPDRVRQFAHKGLLPPSDSPVKAPAHRAEDAAEQSERDMLARGRQASGEPR